VLILIGTELFSVSRPEESWQKAGGQHAPWVAKFNRGNPGLPELCDVTQQIYLGMQPGQQWLQERWELKHPSWTEGARADSWAAEIPGPCRTVVERGGAILVFHDALPFVVASIDRQPDWPTRRGENRVFGPARYPTISVATTESPLSDRPRPHDAARMIESRYARRPVRAVSVSSVGGTSTSRRLHSQVDGCLPD